MKGILRIFLDGPREREIDLPDNYRELAEDAQRAITRSARNELINDTVAMEISTEYDEDDE